MTLLTLSVLRAAILPCSSSARNGFETEISLKPGNKKKTNLLNLSHVSLRKSSLPFLTDGPERALLPAAERDLICRLRAEGEPRTLAKLFRINVRKRSSLDCETTGSQM